MANINKMKDNNLISTDKGVNKEYILEESTTENDNTNNEPKVPFELYIESYAPKYDKTSFISGYNGCFDEAVIVKGDKNRLMQIHDYIARVSIDFDNKKYTILPKLAGIVLLSSIVNLVANNRTNQAPIENYEVVIQKAINKKKVIVRLSSEDIANDKQFLGKLGTLSTLSCDEIKEFISKFVLKNNAKNIVQFKNPGRVNFKDTMWIWSNAIYYLEKVYAEDEDGNIDIKIVDNTYYKVDKNTKRILPKYVPHKKPVSDTLFELFENIYEAWGGAIEPYLALGFMALSCYCPEFWKKEGFGVLAFVGDTEAGKTEITALGLGLYGYDKSFMASTRCTLVGIEQKMNSANCVPIIIDDLSKLKLAGDNFIEEMKRISHGLTRDKGLNGQESGALPPCSTFGFSSNYLPCEKGEVLNRLLYLNTENLNFYPQKYKYFGKAVDELSCVLPYILERGFDEIDKIHTTTKQMLLNKFVGSSDRMMSQIAIAITGLKVFQNIAGNKQLKIPFNDKLPEYINKCINRFKIAKNPIDKLLEVFPVLIWKNYIKENRQFEIRQTNGMTTLKFFKTAICTEYNRYIAEDSTERINSRAIKEIDGENFKVLKFNKPAKIGGETQHSIMLDITDYPLTPKILDACRTSGDSKY